MGKEIDTSFYPDGQIYILTRKTNGKKDGKQEWFDKSGNFWKIFKYQNDSLTGAWIEYYTDVGTAKFYGIYNRNIPTGEWFEYYKNGKIKSRGNYCDKEIVNLINDSSGARIEVRDAEWKLKQTTSYSQELYDSLMSTYGYDGKFIVYPFERYIKDGIWKYYDEQGNLTREETYECGQLKITKNY